MQFEDPELQSVYERNFRCLQYEDSGLREVQSILGAYDWFHLIDRHGSPRVAAIMDALLSPDLRPALRRWYARCGESMNPAAVEFRERLSNLAGEKF